MERAAVGVWGLLAGSTICIGRFPFSARLGCLGMGEGGLLCVG